MKRGSDRLIDREKLLDSDENITVKPAEISRRELLKSLGVLGLGAIAGYLVGNYFPYIQIKPVGEKVRAIIGTQWPMPSFDQMHYKMGKGGMLVTDLVYEKTYVNDFSGNVAPRAAKGPPEVSDDKLHLWWNISEGIKFHDGSDFTADDIAESYEWMLDESPRAKYYASIEKIEAEDKHRIRFDLSRKDVTFYWFNQWYECVLPKGTRDRVAAEEINLDMPPDEIMSGPMKMKEFVPDQYCLLEKWDGYYGKPDSPNEMSRPPEVDEIQFKIIRESSTMIASMHSGETDVILYVPYKDFNDLSAKPTFYGLSAPYSFSFGSFFGFNCGRKPFDDPNVRKAFSWAINRQEICDLVYYGLAEVSPVGASPKAWYYSEEAAKMVGYDPDKAKEYLREAGMSDGYDMTVVLRHDPEIIAVCELVKSQVAKVGINMALNDMETATYFGVRSSKDFDIFYEQWTGVFDVGQCYPQFIYPEGAYNVWIDWKAPERATELCLMGQQFADNESRYSYYEEMQKILMEEVPLVFTHTPVFLNLCQNYVKGYKIATGGQPHFCGLRIAKEG